MTVTDYEILEHRIWVAFEASPAWSDLEDEFWEEATFTPEFEDGLWTVRLEMADRKDVIYSVTQIDDTFSFTKEE